MIKTIIIGAEPAEAHIQRSGMCLRMIRGMLNYPELPAVIQVNREFLEEIRTELSFYTDMLTHAMEGAE